MAGFTVCPRVELEFAALGSTKFSWYRSQKFSDEEQNEQETTNVATSSNLKEGQSDAKPDTSKYKWEKVGEGYTYTSSPDDVHRYLKINCSPISETGYIGQDVEATASAPVGSGPGPCPFEKRHIFTRNITKVGRFRVASYNILADLYADSNFSRTELFPTCPPYALAIDYRKQLLLKEIQGYNCDLLCLQEVDTKIFDHLLLPTLEMSNYEGIFTPKAGKVAEGLACFYNKSKFSLVSHHDVILGKALEEEPAFEDFLKAISKNETLKTKIAELTTVLQVVILKSLDYPNRKLCVANIHLYSKPEWCNIRLIQTGLCLRHLEQAIALEKAQDPSCSVALMFTGDFNSSPDYGVYQYITTQFIPDDHPDWKSDSEDVIENFCLTHPFYLTSACGTPQYTNFTLGFTGCLDYIFADDSYLRVEEVVPLPNHDELAPYMGLPSITMPSDHLALVCTLKWM